MVSMTMATSEWIQFFKEAGIPPGPAVSYAVMFVDNRIRKNMLLDLTKELMNELGITVVGDVIAILKHAKVVYRQEMCKAATELLLPASPPVQAELRRSANSAASRMIANSLSRDPLPAAPQPHGSKISVTVPNQPAAAKAGLGNAAAGIPSIPVKRRRVTAEMEGKYIITMPKGTTPRTRKILAQQQAAKGLPRTSVFDRLGAEARGDTAAGGKPTGVFSRLGDSLRDKSMDDDDDDDDDGDGSALPYAGVLKKPNASRKEMAEPGMPVKAKGSSVEAKPIPSLRNAAGISPMGEGREGEDGVSSSSSSSGGGGGGGGDREKSKRECRVMIRRTWGCGKVSSSSEARMDKAGSVSVFQRLGKKSD